jgi:hypothetical protein
MAIILEKLLDAEALSSAINHAKAISYRINNDPEHGMIFTIGTSNRSLSEFLVELQSRSITQIVDLRSSPVSRLPWFNAGQIGRWAERAAIHYRQEGEVLGGRSEYDIDSAVYHSTIERVIRASCRETIALFCAEGDPRECHRSYEVSAFMLARFGIITRNVLRDGSLEDATDTLARTPQGRIPASIRDKINPIFRSKTKCATPQDTSLF